MSEETELTLEEVEARLREIRLSVAADCGALNMAEYARRLEGTGLVEAYQKLKKAGVNYDELGFQFFLASNRIPHPRGFKLKD